MQVTNVCLQLMSAKVTVAALTRLIDIDVDNAMEFVETHKYLNDRII